MSRQFEWNSGDLKEARVQDGLVIMVVAGVVLGLILMARGSTLPMHGTNDLSRWATVYSLVERGTYQIDETPWPSTIDRVQFHGHNYSSKPPLLPTLLAGEYWLLKRFSFGKLNFVDTPESVIRIILVTVNLIPLIVFLILYSRLLDRLTAHPWIRLYAMMAAGLGTYLTAYSTTLNNHTIAAFSCLFSLYPAYRIWCEGENRWWYFALAGFFAAFTAVNELPALSLLGVLGLALMRKSFQKVLCFFVPFVLLPILGHTFTNYLVTRSWKPAYAYKQAYEFPGSYWKIDPATGRLVGSRVDPTTGKTVLKSPEGIDNQYEPWHVYLFHMLVGHHGIFSLSPIFVLTVLGLIRQLRPSKLPLSSGGTLISSDTPPAMDSKPFQFSSRWGAEGWREESGKDPRVNGLNFFACLTIGLTALLMVFYLFFAGQRNYGGICNGLRWLFWLIPLWLIFLPLGLEGRVSRQGFRIMALIFLLVSAASTFYASKNPWTRPWLQQWLYYHQWIKY
ncbi:MAG TPA: hypothetical protein VMW38_28870 [Terriglobia bacterium]|nr:hypothetical protein [Terriglobia bacterium]